jgi:hypothetical protein
MFCEHASHSGHFVSYLKSPSASPSSLSKLMTFYQKHPLTVFLFQFLNPMTESLSIPWRWHSKPNEVDNNISIFTEKLITVQNKYKRCIIKVLTF